MGLSFGFNSSLDYEPGQAEHHQQSHHGAPDGRGVQRCHGLSSDAPEHVAKDGNVVLGGLEVVAEAEHSQGELVEIETETEVPEPGLGLGGDGSNLRVTCGSNSLSYQIAHFFGTCVAARLQTPGPATVKYISPCFRATGRPSAPSRKSISDFEREEIKVTFAGKNNAKLTSLALLSSRVRIPLMRQSSTKCRTEKCCG